MFGSTYRLGKVYGIPVGIHWSLLVVLLLILVSFTGSFEDITRNQTTAFIYAAAAAVLFYLSILLHEFGHAVVARRNRIGISGIDLWMFGGIAKMQRDADSPGVEFRVAAAGPLVTVIISVLLIAGGAVAFGADEFRHSLLFEASTDESPMFALLTFLASINILLLGFNLVPAFPLDGGRIARSIAWRVTGDRTRGTTFAAMLGQMFSYLMIGLGVFLMTGLGDVWFIQKGLFNGLWFAFIGMFIGDAARSAVYQTAVLSRIEGVRVADVMDREPVAIPATMTIRDAMHEYFLRYRYPWYPVVDSYGRFSGVVQAERAQGVAAEKQPVFKVAEIMLPEPEQFRVRSDDPLEALLTSDALRRLGALVAVDTDGRLNGIVTIEQINRALQSGVSAPTA